MVSGHALHSGVFCEVRFHVEEGPVRFVRNGTNVEATLQNVTSTERCTTLSYGEESVALVEHLLGRPARARLVARPRRRGERRRTADFGRLERAVAARTRRPRPAARAAAALGNH